MNQAAVAKTALIIFAKAPIPGLAKTRLIPALGAKGAATLAQRLLEHAVKAGLDAQFAHLELCTTPDTKHPAFVRLAANAGVVLTEQGEGDLGVRMDRALKRCLAQHPRTLLIGTDIPSWNAAILQEASRALQTHEAVFTPTHDGGYALVGLSKPCSGLFRGMRWSHTGVMDATRARVHAAKLLCKELALVADIDEATDLVHLPPQWLN